MGGDWYDVLALPDGRLALAMGDVVGRGVPAASLMGQLRNGLRAYVVEGRSPAQVLSLLNRLLRDVGAPHQMATLVVMLLDPETGELRYANAGHPPPLVAGRGRHARSSSRTRSACRWAPSATPSTPRPPWRLTPGSTLVLYTDGLVEDRTMSLDVGLDRLRASLLTAPDDVDAMCEHLTAHVRATGAAQDDVAVLAVRWLALGATIELQVPSQARVLRPLRAALRRWLAAGGVPDHEAFEILVATSEACSNAIRHGAPQATHFDLKAELNGDVAIVVRSSGRWRERRSSAPGGQGARHHAPVHGRHRGRQRGRHHRDPDATPAGKQHLRRPGRVGRCDLSSPTTTASSSPASRGTSTSGRPATWAGTSCGELPDAALGLVLDLTDVRYVDSGGVRVFFELAAQLEVVRAPGGPGRARDVADPPADQDHPARGGRPPVHEPPRSARR